ncbi:MAG: diguanylate cyclase [Actinobacteria bacterium]|nr:MAG: diguanylate cyclase [Actinomycetota bacterium]
MRYETFEKFALLLGGAAVLSALVFVRNPPVIEIAAQLLLLGVVGCAVHWGRKGGMAAAVAASLAYILLHAPSIVAAGAMTASLFAPLLTRVLTYGIVGIGGGELCGRIKYVFSAMEDDSAVDEWTRIYNQRQIARLLSSAHGQHVRYGNPYGVIVVALAPALTSELRVTKQRSLLRSVADHIRGDVRLVDDVGRLDDGRFVVLLPQTARSGALIAAERVRAGIRDLVGARDESVDVQVFAAPEDLAALEALAEVVAPPDAAGEGSA